MRKRQRQGRLVNFIDHDELYAKNLTIFQPLKNHIAELDTNEIGIDPSSSSTSSTNQKIINAINRVVIDEFKVVFLTVNRHDIVLTAKHAKLLTETMVMRLDDLIVKSAKCKISADFALWSSEYKGLFFPESYRYNQKNYQIPAFFQITENGKCQKARSTPVIEYIDQLDIIETKLVETMPSSFKLIYGLLAPPINQ